MQALWNNRVFRVVVAADLVQQIAIWIRNIALLFYVMDQTGNDPVAVSLLTAIEYAPIFLFSFIGGTLADRWNPKKTLMAGDLLSAASIAAIILLVSMGNWQAVFAATFVSAIVSQISLPSSAVIFKKFIPEQQVSAAIGIQQSMMSLFVIAGPIIGTAVYSWIGLSNSLICLCVLFLLSALIQMWLPSTPKPEAAAASNLWSEMKEGFRYVRASRNLLVIAVVFSLIGLGSGIIQPLSVFVLMERLGLEKESLQWFSALGGLGMLVGGIAAAAVADRLKAKPVLFAGLCFLAVSTVVEVLSVWIALTAAMGFLVGVAMAFMQIVLSALMIRLVDDAYIGRTNGAITPLMTAGILIGSSLSGVIVQSSTLTTAYLISAAIILAAACCGLALRALKANQEIPKTDHAV